MYGKDNKPYKIDVLDKERSYLKLCGQEFWELITGDTEFYQRIVVPIDKEAKKRDDRNLCGENKRNDKGFLRAILD